MQIRKRQPQGGGSQEGELDGGLSEGCCCEGSHTHGIPESVEEDGDVGDRTGVREAVINIVFKYLQCCEVEEKWVVSVLIQRNDQWTRFRST